MLSVAAFWVGALLQVAGADGVQRPSAVPGETAVDAVVASLEPEGGVAPRYAMRSEFVLLLRADLLARHAPGALTTEVDSSVSTAVLEWLLGELAVVREAERGGGGDPDPELLASLRQRMVTRMGGEAAVTGLLEATGLSAGEFDSLLRRRAVAMAWLLERHPRLIEPEDTAVREAYESSRYASLYREGATLGEARRSIRQALVENRYPQALRQFLRGLGSRVRVKVYVDTGAS